MRSPDVWFDVVVVMDGPVDEHSVVDMHPTDASSLVMTELSQKGWELLTAYPTMTFYRK